MKDAWSLESRVEREPSMRNGFCLIFGSRGTIVEGSYCANLRGAVTLLADRVANREAFPLERVAPVHVALAAIGNARAAIAKAEGKG